jgi:hypothetical protein
MRFGYLNIQKDELGLCHLGTYNARAFVFEEPMPEFAPTPVCSAALRAKEGSLKGIDATKFDPSGGAAYCLS